jgi:hypothetical protein
MAHREAWRNGKGLRIEPCATTDFVCSKVRTGAPAYEAILTRTIASLILAKASSSWLREGTSK